MCKNLSLKTNFHKDKTKNDGLNVPCKVCRKQCYIENLVKIKKHYLSNRDRINDCYSKNYDEIIARKETFSNKRRKKDFFPFHL